MFKHILKIFGRIIEVREREREKVKIISSLALWEAKEPQMPCS